MELNTPESIKKPDNSRVLYQAITKAEYGAIERADMTLLPEPGVYCIFNTASNRCYIGCSVNVYSRIQTHKRQISAGNHICRGMVDDYSKNPDAFRFFCIQHVPESDYDATESFRMALLMLETQHTKRVPLGMLYNSVVPASLSEKLLRAERKRQEKPIKITEIIARLQMSEDSIRSNGFTNSSVLHLDDAIEFVQKRTFPSGRWPAEKAVLAKDYLAELNALLPSGDDVEGLLMQGGVMDYFNDSSYEFQKVEDIPKVRVALRWERMKAAHEERSKKPPVIVKKPLTWPLWVGFLIPTLASAFNTYNVSHQITKDWWVALFVMAMVMLTPALFIAARVSWMGGIIAFGVVLFEGFCNLSAIYLSLMGNMQYILDGKRGQCSNFLQSVVDLTNRDHRPTALLIGVVVAVLISTTQLAAFWTIRKRF